MRDRSGVALPVALVGLVAVSLLVTTTLLTSTTESAISNAQVQAARSLYAAEGGVLEYLRTVGVGGLQLQPGVQTVTLPETGEQVQVTTSVLEYQAEASGRIRSTVSLMAQPLRNGQPRGRAVVAMVRQEVPPPVPLNANITSAITLGGNLHVNGNAFTVSGHDACNDAGHEQNDVQAVRSAEDSRITTNNQNHMRNFEGVDLGGNDANGWDAIERTDMTRNELAANVLGGTTVGALVAMVDDAHRWGPRFGRPNWDGYLEAEEKVAVVDGRGGLVDLYGGEGILIVVNGGVRMRGSSFFKGIIIAEGNFDLKGTPTVQGALISLSTDGVNEIELDASAIGAGHVTVQYDKCLIDGALSAFGEVTGPQTPVFSGTTFGWSEVVQ